jgi:monofunctional biosynthetic peptidoglycan transglycosylase
MTERRLNKKKVVWVAMLLGIAALFLYQLGLFLMVLWYSFQNPGTTAFMSAALRELRVNDPTATISQQWVPYDQISASLKRAVVASEDSNFFAHEGVEWEAIRHAWEYNRRQAQKGETRRLGGSTITQQLAKNLFLSSSRSYLRKGQELILTYMIEAVMDKRRILELYLNVAQWGKATFGAQAAARHYFKTDAHRLGNRQAAQLAAMLPNPVLYDAKRNTPYLNSRTNTVEQRLRQIRLPD